MSLERVRVELGDVVCGRKPGRLTPEEIVVFDSTGLAFKTPPPPRPLTLGELALAGV